MIKTFSRLFITLLFLLIQLSVANLLYLAILNRIFAIRIFYSLVCLCIILKIIKESNNYSYILPWIIIFVMFPVPGTLMYLNIRFNLKHNKLIKSILKEEEKSKEYLTQDKKIIQDINDRSHIRYISEYAKFLISKDNDITYFPLGDYAIESMIKELKKAKKFIFFEYFIVKEGVMWNSILDVLIEKANEGVEVRVMYDDFGCLTKLDKHYYKKLREKGIKCVPFNRLKVFGGIVKNNRDHRKILVIDGKVAFSGGINISDEYININSKFGHWKDNCFYVKGNAVWNYTVMFLTLWNAITHEDDDYSKYKYKYKNKKNTGIVAPYGANPLDANRPGEDIYLNIINQANKYVYILTPYLIIDTGLINALILAAKRGVDVRIVIPGIPDKKAVYSISESYTETLVKGGVKVYKYTPGFVHSKVFVSDDIKATVGTINMDYRSLYLHFECGCYFEEHSVIKDIKDDLDNTIESSHLITKEEAKTKPLKAFKQSVLRLFAPLM